jgi:chromosome segregation protein
VRLKSLTLKGFKSFPDRTQLDFGPGVSVVVGPNGSGKSNVTDAVLWAMGEQSPLAVRGQSMQDVIFGGGRGVQARSAAEVEIVLDNSDGTIEVPLSEISIVRRLDRAGEGGYRLNGARCRLTDVIEVLSDTGLGKETHTVVSQGRVEAIVTSKPRERRLLIEEAAGLGKHRKRRRRAQLKLERTQQNLDRSLDVEREARTRLRPLKRQAEAAELHERLERQMLEARWELVRDALRARAVELDAAEAEVKGARATQAEIEKQLQAMVERRGRAERALGERAEHNDALARRSYEARSAHERLGLRGEQVGACAQTLHRRIEQVKLELSALSESAAETTGAGEGVEHGEAKGRIESLQAELAEIESRHEQQIEREIEDLDREHEQAGALLAELERELQSAREARQRAEERAQAARDGRIWSVTWTEVRQVIVAGVERVLALREGREREIAAGEVVEQAERVAKGAIEHALGEVSAVEDARAEAEDALRDVQRRHAEASEAQRRVQWLIEQRKAAPQEGPLAVRGAQLEGELAAERRQAEHLAGEQAERLARIERLRARHVADVALAPAAERLAEALKRAGEAVQEQVKQLEEQRSLDRAAGEEMAGELRACAVEEAEIQAALRGASEAVTSVEVAAQRLRDQAQEITQEAQAVGEALELSEQARAEEAAPLAPEQVQALSARVQRLQRRREQLGPVNPLAQEEYAEAVSNVEELESRRADLETALRELKTVIRSTDRQIQETFEETFAAAARNFEELAGDVFPGGSGRLRLVRDEQLPRGVLGGQPLRAAGTEGSGDGHEGGEQASEEEAEREEEAQAAPDEELLGVEIEITPAGKSTKRLSLLSGGEKSMTALAFLFAVFLARPCPFYILDEVEAALDDQNLDRFLALLRRYSGRAQFIVITHQKRTMEAADWLFGVSMGGDGVSKVLSRRLPAEQDAPPTHTPPAHTLPAQAPEVAEVA